MTTRRGIGLSAIVTALVLCLLVLSALSLNTPSSQAAPLAAPTPLAVAPKNAAPEFPTIFSSKVISADVRSDCFEVPDYAHVDLHWVIDMAAVNTTTLKLQHSNNNTSYVDGISFVSAAVADAESMQQYAIFGRWTCVYADVATTDLVTLTVLGVVK